MPEVLPPVLPPPAPTGGPALEMPASASALAPPTAAPAPATAAPLVGIGPALAKLLPYALTSLMWQAAAQETSLTSLYLSLPTAAAGDEGKTPERAAAAVCLASTKATLAQLGALLAASGGDDGSADEYSVEGGTLSINDRIAGLHVLVVDNQALVRRQASQILADLGCTCEVLEDGCEIEAALQAQRTVPIGAITMAIVMAHSDGNEIAARLRARGCDLPLVAVTAFAGARPLARFYESGFDVVGASPALPSPRRKRNISPSPSRCPPPLPLPHSQQAADARKLAASTHRGARTPQRRK